MLRRILEACVKWLGKKVKCLRKETGRFGIFIRTDVRVARNWLVPLVDVDRIGDIDGHS